MSLSLKNTNNIKEGSWWPRALLVTFFLYLLVRYILDLNYFNVFFYGINLGIHEAGHYVVFRFFGQFMSTIGGSLLECLAPILAIATFYRKRDFFAISFCFGWLATALFDTATYIADAQEMSLPLLFGEHDWNIILSKFGLLQYDDAIAMGVRFLALASMMICIFWGYSIVWKLYRQK